MWEELIQCLWSWHVGGADTMFVELACGRSWYNVCGAGMWEELIQCLWSWHVGGADTMFVELACGRS